MTPQIKIKRLAILESEELAVSDHSRGPCVPVGCFENYSSNQVRTVPKFPFVSEFVGQNLPDKRLA